MIAYNKEWLYNIHVRRQADEALQDACISADTRERIYAARPVGFYQVGFWAGVGFALVTWLIIASATGLFEIVFNAYESSTLSLVIGIICYALAEGVIQLRKHYNSGIDNMLIWAAGAGLQIGLIMLLTNGRGNSSTVTASLIVFTLSGFLALRFADQLLSCIAFMGFFCLVYFSWIHGIGYRAAAPYVMMAASAIVYFISARYLRSYSTLYYRNCLLCINVMAMVALYASGNFFMTKEMWEGFDYYPTQVSRHMSTDWFFWIWTFAIPVIYIIAGLRKKDIIHIRTGAVLFVASIITFRFYHFIISKEAALITSGIIITATAYALIQYLKEPKRGFTFQAREMINPVSLSSSSSGTEIKKDTGHL